MRCGHASPNSRRTSTSRNALAKLRTERLVLRGPRASDAPALLRYYIENTDHLERWEPQRSPNFSTVAYHAEWIASREHDERMGYGVSFLLFEATIETVIIGVVNLWQIVRGVYEGAILGYSIDARHEGKGLASEAVTAVLAFAFGTLGLHRVTANYHPTNERSGALLRKLGFVVEGYARDYLRINGEWRDSILTAAINPKWARR